MNVKRYPKQNSTIFVSSSMQLLPKTRGVCKTPRCVQNTVECTIPSFTVVPQWFQGVI